MKIHFSADSTCDVSPEFLARYPVEILPLTVELEGKFYRDGVDLTPDTIISRVNAGAALPKTSAVNVEEYRTAFTRALETSDAVIHFNISSEFSSCHQNACIAAEGLNVWCIDSRNLSTGITMLLAEGFDRAEADMEPEQIAKELRLTIIDVMAWSGGAHVGGSLSIVEILTLLYFKYLNIDPKNPKWEDRDRFILSKGHTAAGYIPVLAKRGYFDEDLLKSFNHFGSPFAMHPDCNKVIGCDASAGSLGHGLSMAVGLGLGAKQLKKPWKTVCLMGDGECCEGSVWEAAMSAAHFKLDNVIGIVDRNRLMIDGCTEDVMALEPFADKWRAFGWNVIEVNGHDLDELDCALDAAWKAEGKPTLILANTVKGKGVDFMENNVVYHYASGDSALCEKAKASIMRG